MADPKKPDPKVAGKSFLERVLAKLPEEQRTTVAAVLLADEGVLAEAGEGALLKEDYTRGVQEVAANRQKVQVWKEGLDKWWAGEVQERAALEARVAAGGGAGGNGDDDVEEVQPKLAKPSAIPADVARKSDLEAMRDGFRAEGTQLAAVLVPLALRHQKEFDEILEIDQLVTHCRTTGLQIDRGGYDSFVKEKRGETSEKTRAKELAEAKRLGVEEGLEKAKKDSLSEAPGPTKFEAGTLSGLTRKDPTKDAGSRSVVDRAVADFNRRMAAKSSA